MNAAFVLSGILLLLGVAGIFQGISKMNPRARWICASLLALSPVGAIVCGIFTLESMMLHSSSFLLALGSPIVKPGFLELAQFGCRLELRDRVQFLECRGERIRKTPDRSRPEFLVLRL